MIHVNEDGTEMTHAELRAEVAEFYNEMAAEMIAAGRAFGLLDDEGRVGRLVARRERHDSYFGFCPECSAHDGYFNVGKAHWFVCHCHRTRWCAGSGLFSSWREETEAEQRHSYDVAPGWGAYRIVTPLYGADA